MEIYKYILKGYTILQKRKNGFNDILYITSTYGFNRIEKRNIENIVI